MEIYLDKRAARQIRQSAEDAIEEGDTETLREDIFEAFSDEQIEDIERHLDNGDFFEFLTDMLDDWSGDDVDELFDLLETSLGDLNFDLKYAAVQTKLTPGHPTPQGANPYDESETEHDPLPVPDPDDDNEDNEVFEPMPPEDDDDD